jgi:ubiquinone/menaquinone biosynthesis C-methylase UbiE
MKHESLELLQLRPGLDVLEVGIGLGDELESLADAVLPGRAVGVDQSEQVVAFARARHPKREIRQGNAQSLAFPDSSFDRYRAERLYQHLPEPERALQEALRVLRPGGLLTIGDPDWRTLRLGSDDLDLEGLLRERVCRGVTSARVADLLGPALPRLGGELVATVPHQMRFRAAKTIERIVDSVEDGLSGSERREILAEARRLEAAGSLEGSLTLIWIVGAKPD